MPHRVATLLAAVLLAALPSAAVDLTGTWQAAKGLRCKVRSNADSGFVETDFNVEMLSITQAGDVVTILVNEGSGDYENKYQGPSLSHPKKEGKGYAVATACTVDGKYYAGSFFIRKADAVKGRLKVVYHGTRFSTVAECKGSYERVSNADPMVAATCP